MDEAGTGRTACYTRLPPGNYTLQVRASNNDGVCNDTGATLQFTLLPHFYRTTWFLYSVYHHGARLCGAVVSLTNWSAQSQCHALQNGSRQLDIERLEFDVRDLVGEVGAIMAFQASAKRIELIVHVRGDVPTGLSGDPQRIRQCLLNLVGNAVKFTQRGHVVLEVTQAADNDGRVRLTFSVHGIGIATAAIDRLFMPFTQAGSSTPPRREHTRCIRVAVNSVDRERTVLA